MRHKQLAERVKFLKENKGEVGKMSSIIAEAKEKILIENIRSLMKTTKWSAKQSMDSLEVPANEQEKYIALI